jgi:plastocyanin
MAKQYSIVIKDDQFQPSNLHLQVGDSIVWDNQGDHDHTATSNNRRIVFDTGVIAAGTASKPVLFDKVSSYGGVSFFCKLHPLMQGRLVVWATPPPQVAASATSASTATASTPPPPVPGLTFSIPVWVKIARIVAAHWVYDMSDDFQQAIQTSLGPTLVALKAEWALVEALWKQQTGSTKTILDSNYNIDPTAFQDESLENLEVVGRRIRLASNNLASTVNISQYPYPFRPDAVRHFGELYPGQSSIPFGEAVTINYVGVPIVKGADGFGLTDIQLAEAHHEDFVFGALWPIESLLDAGLPISDQLKQIYLTTRAALKLEDFHLLASHLYFGISTLFNAADFQEDQFKAGIQTMTARGEWDGSFSALWHWLRWIQGYITVKETGQLPNPLDY